MPKISAVMALYNTPYHFLEATVKSLIEQTFKDFELIIIDDASSVEYEKFFEKFRDERIKYHKLDKNSGPGKARNEGIKKAQGEYIAIVDSDDVYMPNRFEIQAEFLDNNQEISLISSAFKQSNNGKIPSVEKDNEDIKIFMLFNSPFANPAVMFRKDAFLEKNLFYPENKNFAEDYELWTDAMLKEIKMANIDEVLMIYTRRKGQLSKEKADKQAETLKELYYKVLSSIGISASKEELILHHNIYSQNYSEITIDEIKNWFNKIIDANKTSNVFNEQKLISKKEEVLKQFENIKNRIFKLKIGQYNFCINKPLKLYFEKRL